MQEISKEEALKEMRFLFNGYKDITNCSNPSKANIRLMQACEFAIIAIEEKRKEGEWEEIKLFGRDAYQCPFCKDRLTRTPYLEKYCSFCGAKLRTPEEEETT